MKTAIGRHFLVELAECDAAPLRHADPLREIMLDAARECGATVVGFAFHQFLPEGASGTLLLAESHFSVHTWPEERYLAMDIFTCGTEMDAERAIEIVRRRVRAQRVEVQELARGC